MSWEYSTSGSATWKAGKNADTTILANASALNKFYDEAIGLMCMEAHTDLTSLSGTLAQPIKDAIGEVVSSMVATKIAVYNPRVYTASELSAILNVNDETINKGMTLIKNKNNLQLTSAT